MSRLLKSQGAISSLRSVKLMMCRAKGRGCFCRSFSGPITVDQLQVKGSVVLIWDKSDTLDRVGFPRLAVREAYTLQTANVSEG
jgi:hypothetical protein